MIKRVLASLFILTTAMATSSTTIESVRQLVLEKHLDEATTVLREHEKELLASTQNQRQVSGWYRTFQYDSTLGFFEKALDMNLPDKNSADKSTAETLEERLQILQKAYEKEPYNLQVISFLLPTLWLLKKEAQAQEVLDKALKEMPFLPQYKIFQSWSKPGNVVFGNSCDSTLLVPVEREFCYYVKVQQRLQNPNLSPRDRILKNYLQKTSIPNKHFLLWEKWKNLADKQKYLSSCQALSGKSKKTYFLVPDLCTKEPKP